MIHWTKGNKEFLFLYLFLSLMWLKSILIFFIKCDIWQNLMPSRMRSLLIYIYIYMYWFMICDLTFVLNFIYTIHFKIIFLLGFLNFLRSLLVKFIASIGNRFFLIDVATYKVCKHLVTIEKTVGGNGIITKICLSMLNVTMYIKSLSHSPKFHQLFPSIG